MMELDTQGLIPVSKDRGPVPFWTQYHMGGVRDELGDAITLGDPCPYRRGARPPSGCWERDASGSLKCS